MKVLILLTTLIQCADFERLISNVTNRSPFRDNFLTDWRIDSLLKVKFKPEFILNLQDSCIHRNMGFTTSECSRIVVSCGKSISMAGNVTNNIENIGFFDNIFMSQSTHIIAEKETLDSLFSDVNPLSDIPSRQFHNPATQFTSLILITTCNQLRMTILALQQILFAQPDANIVIVDDHSIGLRIFSDILVTVYI